MINSRKWCRGDAPRRPRCLKWDVARIRNGGRGERIRNGRATHSFQTGDEFISNGRRIHFKRATHSFQTGDAGRRPYVYRPRRVVRYTGDASVSNGRRIVNERATRGVAPTFIVRVVWSDTRATHHNQTGDASISNGRRGASPLRLSSALSCTYGVVADVCSDGFERTCVSDNAVVISALPDVWVCG